MREIFRFKILSLFIVAIGLFLGTSLTASATSLPPWPVIYSGTVTVDGEPAPDGGQLRAKIGDFSSVPVTVMDGIYTGLAVGGPDSSYFGKMITFHLDDSVVATETDSFAFVESPKLKSGFDLTFPAYPTPTPLPTAVPTSTPIASPTPEVPSAMLLSGVIELDAGETEALIGKEIVARVGSYFSDPVAIQENYGLLVFDQLMVDPRDYKFLGMGISLIIDGLMAGGNSAVFQSGGSVDLALRVSIPASTDGPGVVVVSESPEPVPVIEPSPTITPSPEPTATLVPAVKPTVIPPTVAPVVVVVTATPDSSGNSQSGEGNGEEDVAGGCNAAGAVSPVTGAANALMLFAPLMFVAGYKGMRRRQK